MKTTKRIEMEARKRRYLSRFAIAALTLIALTFTGASGSPRASSKEHPATPWSVHARRVEKSLAEHDVTAATRAWRDAYRAAVKSLSWEGLVEVGDAYVRIGEMAGDQKAKGKAREIYLTALSRARREDSFDGVLEIAEAFAALGDRQLVRQALEIADLMAAQDPEAEADLEALRQRVTEPPPGPGDHESHRSPDSPR